jgi:hypothetical protein
LGRRGKLSESGTERFLNAVQVDLGEGNGFELLPRAIEAPTLWDDQLQNREEESDDEEENSQGGRSGKRGGILQKLKEATRGSISLHFVVGEEWQCRNGSREGEVEGEREREDSEDKQTFTK